MKIPAFPSLPKSPLLMVTILVLTQLTGRSEKPFYEETFDSGGETVEFIREASVGGPGSGVSGKPEDLSYEAAPVAPGEAGPLARILTELPSTPMEEFTILAWYKSPQSPLSGNVLNTRGVVLSCGNDQWFLRVNDSHGTGAGEKYYSSGTGITTAAGEWQFLAVTWNRSQNTAAFYSGSKTAGTEMMTESILKGDAPQLGFSEPAHVRAIGNTYARAADGAFPGNLDNIRMFDKALGIDQIEAIRKADAANQKLKP